MVKKSRSRQPAARVKQTAVRSSGPPTRRSEVNVGAIAEEGGQTGAGDLADGNEQNVANPQRRSPSKRAGQPLHADETTGAENSGSDVIESGPDDRVQDAPVRDERVEENPRSRKRVRHAEQESDSGNEDGDRSLNRRDDMNQNEEDREKIDLWENDERPLEQEVRIERLWKDKVKRFKDKKEDPKRAFTFETVKQYCGNRPERIFEALGLADEYEVDLRRKWNKDVGLKSYLNISRKHLVLAKFLMDLMEEEDCFKLISKLRLESGWERRNAIVWEAFKIARDCEDTMTFEELRKKLRKEFNRTSSDGGKRQLARATVKGDVVFICILTETTRNSKAEYSVAFFATDKKIPAYLFVGGRPDESMIESVSSRLGGTGITSCNLREVGLDTVIGICKQPTSATILATRGHEIQERVQAQERAVSFISLSQYLQSMDADLQQEQQPSREVLAEVMKVEPEEGGGMKNLKLKFKQPGNKSITFKVTTKKGGSMSADLAAMYTRGTLSDSTRKAFLLAKDKKTNNLTLDWSEEDGGTWVADD